MSDFSGNMQRERYARELAKHILTTKDDRPVNAGAVAILAGEYTKARSRNKALGQMLRDKDGNGPVPTRDEWPVAAPSPVEIEAIRSAGYTRVADWCAMMVAVSELTLDQETA